MSCGPAAFAAQTAGAPAAALEQTSGAPAAPVETSRQIPGTESSDGQVGTHGATYPVTSGTRLQTFPGSSFYPRYLADPRQPVMRSWMLHVLESDTAAHSSFLLEFTMGGRVRLLRWHPANDPELGVQFSIHSAFLGRFDPHNNYDALGWDGYFGAMFAIRPVRGLGIKVAHQHDSAHVADEYIQRTGRRRIVYTREEAALGVMYDAILPLRVYAEVGYAVHLGTAEGLRRWRTQGGAELDFGLLYAAADFNFWQEQRWRPTFTGQLGVKSEQKAIGRRYGIAFQFENGRSVLGEFYRDQNRTVGGGFWMDL